MMNAHRLLGSELYAISTGDEFKAAVSLWCRAWQQVPAGSLPNDDRILAAFSGAGRAWNRVREVALRGFVLCEDGRLYHRTLCEDVNRALESKASYAENREAGRERLRKWRELKRLKRDGAMPDETPSETVSPAFRNGNETSKTGQDKEVSLKNLTSDSVAAQARVAKGNGHGKFSDPAIRKQRWEQNVMNYLRETLPSEKAADIIVAYSDGELWAKARFEQADAEMKARKAATA